MHYQHVDRYFPHILLMFFFFFYFHTTATTVISTLSLHDALPISVSALAKRRGETPSRLPVAARMAARESNTPSVPRLSRKRRAATNSSRATEGVFDSLARSEEHTTELQSRRELVCRPLLV